MNTVFGPEMSLRFSTMSMLTLNGDFMESGHERLRSACRNYPSKFSGLHSPTVGVIFSSLPLTERMYAVKLFDKLLEEHGIDRWVPIGEGTVEEVNSLQFPPNHAVMLGWRQDLAQS